MIDPCSTDPQEPSGPERGDGASEEPSLSDYLQREGDRLRAVLQDIVALAHASGEPTKRQVRLEQRRPPPHAADSEALLLTTAGAGESRSLKTGPEAVIR